MAPAGPTKNQGRAIGIDLGTTCSCVGVWRSEHNRVDIIANKRGNRTTPSMVAFAGEERLIGESAKEQAASNPTNTVFDVKRLIGKKFHDSSVQSDKCLWPFSVSDHNWRPVIEVQFRGETTKFMPEKISSIVLENFKNIAEEYLDCDVNNVVITVPAYFNDSQRRATRNAAEIAGFNVLQMLNEPTAAAIAYGLDKETYLSRDGEYILIFDLGGGTFDVSVIHVKKNKFVVKAVGGDTHLGGEDFDNRMVKHFVREFRRVHNEDMSGDASAMQRLRSECESAKRNLSYTTETTNELHNLHAQKDFVLKMQRAEFEALNKNLFEECMEIVKQCLNDAHLNKAQISRVVLVGGSTRIPKVQEMLGSYFDGRDVMCKGINPDEAVAYGAALRAAVLNDGNGISHELVDVTPLSLGTCVYEGKMCVIIPRNTPLPVRKEECFTTCFDDQETMCIDVYEGEKKKCKRNNLLGEFDLCGIPRTGRGKPSVYICFDIDVNGILKVSAHHRKSGLRKEIIINLVGTKRLRKRNMKCAFPFAT